MALVAADRPMRLLHRAGGATAAGVLIGHRLAPHLPARAAQHLVLALAIAGGLLSLGKGVLALT